MILTNVKPNREYYNIAKGKLDKSNQELLFEITSFTTPTIVDTIGDFAFANNANLDSLNAERVVTINSNAFNNSGIETITFTTYLKTINNYAFENCLLETINIPYSVTSISSNAFDSAIFLTDINVDAGNGYYESFDGVLCRKSNHKLIRCPEGKDFSNTGGNYEMPDDILGIEDNAFQNVTGLGMITISEYVTSISDFAFSGNDALAWFEVDSDNPNYSSDGGVLFNKDKTTLIRCPEGYYGDYNVPTSVTTIKAHAFSYCFDCTYIEIGTYDDGTHLTTIENFAFDGDDAFDNFTKISIWFNGTRLTWDTIINSRTSDILGARYDAADVYCIDDD